MSCGVQQTALGYLKRLPYLPSSREGLRLGNPSNSEIRRWLKNGSVTINGQTPMPGDLITYPVTELVFFKGSPTQCSMV